MKSYVIIPLLFLFVLTGCRPFAFGEKTAHAGGTGVHVIFIYNKSSNTDAKDHYFDALLAAYDHVPVDQRNITIRTGSSRDLADHYHVDAYPALIVKKNGVTKLRIAGDRDSKTLTEKLSPYLSSR